MDADVNFSGVRLKSDLARLCLPAAGRDPNRKLAWMNSICILFLLIGVAGAKPGAVSIKPLGAMEEVIPAVVELLTPPPTTPQDKTEEATDQDKPDTPQVVMVIPEAPNINFSVPTVGNLLVPNALAAPPPLVPMQRPEPLKTAPVNTTIYNTGGGGDRPRPDYPKIALEQGMQGTVVLAVTADEAGVITDVQVKTSSGYPMLDRSAKEFVRRHWLLAAGKGARVFEAPITYQISAK